MCFKQGVAFLQLKMGNQIFYHKANLRRIVILFSGCNPRVDMEKIYSQLL